MSKAIKSGMPTANLAINKSRIKIYDKNSTTPTYYLEKGQEFQIELFNPTEDTILAKIKLNNKAIGQGGLVLRPGERVFLERYIDVAKKFKFDVYEVSNTEEVKKAIESNGDFHVEFYREREELPYFNLPSLPTWTYNSNPNYFGGTVGNGTPEEFLKTKGSGEIDQDQFTFTTNSLTSGSIRCTASMESLSDESLDVAKYSPIKKLKTKTRSKSIETGRVEKGSNSSQSFDTVNKKWEYSAFHTVQYKLLPISRKVNTVQEIQTKRYCTNCGTKQKPTFKFCPSCGTQA